MPWQEVSTMSLRREFVVLAQAQETSISELCRRFGISRKTGYKWLARYAAGQTEALADRSRRPLHQPSHTPEAVEEQVVALRQQHPAWGGRKIAKRLVTLGLHEAPAPSTVTHILRRRGLLRDESASSVRWRRFEHPSPNDLWQMDFKGYFHTGHGKCHALTVLDDHSRFNLVLQACARTDTPSVRQALIPVFQRYGLPIGINTDNGTPWGNPAGSGALSELTIWWVRLGIRVSHSRPYHPQTNGKDERFHRSLEAEVLNGRAFSDLAQAQRAFDPWRQVYNHERPHDALLLEVPAARYQISTRPYPSSLPPIQYAPDDQVRKVQSNGLVHFKGLILKVSNALRGQPVALRPVTTDDGLYDVFFCHHRLMSLDLRNPD